ncbi:MAG: YdcF family protein [Ectothiorhodospira sp.]
MHTLELLLMPPASGLILTLLGLVLWRHGAGRLLVLLGLGSLYLASLPMVSHALVGGLQQRAGAVTEAPRAGAIVVLAGGRRSDAPEYGGDTVNRYSLVRARYGAVVHRRTGLPLLVSGGRVEGDEPRSEAVLMARVLQEEFGVPVRWREEESRNTCENAFNTARLLAAEGIERAILVTHALHLPRARWCFRRTDLEIRPMPVYCSRPQEEPGFDWRGLIPQARAMERTRFALHEYLGLAWYRVRYADRPLGGGG